MKELSLSPEERRDYLATAQQNSEELERRVDDLLELSRLESPDMRIEPEDFPLEELAEALSQKFMLAAKERSVRIEVSAPEKVPFIRADIELTDPNLHTDDVGLIEAILLPGSPLIGGTLKVSVSGSSMGCRYRGSTVGVRR